MLKYSAVRSLASFFGGPIIWTARRVFEFFGRLGSVLVQSFRNESPQVVGYDWFSDHEVSGYDRVFDADHPERIDDATWRDLDVKAYLRLIGSRSSIFGRQMLYHRLRSGAASPDFSTSPLKTVNDPLMDRALVGTQDARHTLRCVEMESTGLLFHGQLLKIPVWAQHLWMAPFAGTAALTFLMIQPGAVSALLVLAYAIFNACVQVKLHKMLVRWHGQRDSVVAMLGGALAFAREGQKIPHPVFKEVTASEANIRRLISALSPNWLESVPMFAEYANLFGLYEYVTFGNKIGRLKAHLPAVRVVYEQLAECEAQLCLAEHLKTRMVYCWARPVEGRHMRIRQVVNPLLHDAKPLSMDLRGNGAFITGQNGVGKSTFLRGIGLNLLTARAFGFCYAQEAEFAFLPVWSSIQNEDSLETADSLYMAEMRRAEALLRVAERPTGAVFILDEIFRGTNNMESVSAATAVVSHLASRATVLVSSHNLVLAPLLQSRLDALRIVRNDLVGESLRIESGVLVETNGIQMMERYEIPEAIRTHAKEIHDWFAGYMTQPDQFPEL